MDSVFLYFFFNDTATTEIYTLSLHDALPIFRNALQFRCAHRVAGLGAALRQRRGVHAARTIVHPLHARSNHNLQVRSEEHTSELQSHLNLVCRLLLEKKKELLPHPPPLPPHP